ncbi:MAG: type I restriction endonuclease subunit R, partial [Planctomycetes bacterium]|nr:type I restriction endonuclease subunit R [Planctomycetota bacterium]
GELIDSDDELADSEDTEDDENPAATASDADAQDGAAEQKRKKKGPPRKTKPLPVLNRDEDILILVDEAHRSHTSSAHANLMSALPNCAKIGFTGTPIIMRAKGKTADIFGTEIDRYTIRQAESDGAIVPIFYEGRTATAAVQGGGKLDDVFEDMLAPRSKEQLEAIKKKYATNGHVLEAEALIAAKARNMLQHYVAHILPNGYKAQVVAVSRRATIRYDHALRAARDALVAELEALHPNLLGPGSVEYDESALAQLEPYTAFLIRAHRFLPTIRALEFAPVISGAHNDTVDPKREWSLPSKVNSQIARFTQPLFAAGPNSFDHEEASPLAFLIVKSMLLTGFDAPIEQVMYLDRHIKEAELLQAVARVNRTHVKGKVAKPHGIVVDYYGVARHLKDALKAYAKEEVIGALQSLEDEIPKLRDRHHRARHLFVSRGIADPCSGKASDIEACIDLLRDERLRADFHVKLKQFLVTLDLVLPRPEAVPFVHEAKFLSYLQARARNRYRSEEAFVGNEVGAKVRRLIDEHVISRGIDPKIAPIALTASDFEEQVDKHRSPRAKASEMEHALRHHIRKHHV